MRCQYCNVFLHQGEPHTSGDCIQTLRDRVSALEADLQVQKWDLEDKLEATKKELQEEIARLWLNLH